MTPADRRRELLGDETIAELRELAEHAPTLTQQQKDDIRAVFRGGGANPP